MVLTPVTDPSKYGVVVTNDEGKALQFIEKPEHYISNKINAGLYLLSTSILDKIKLEPTSIERETFPRIASEGGQYTIDLDGFWMDVGQPKDYLIGTKLWLDHLKINNDPRVCPEKENIVGNVMIHPSSNIHPGAKIGPNVVIGADCVISDGVRIKNSTILSGTTIDKHSQISDSILGWKCKVGKWVRVENYSVFAEDVAVKDEQLLNGTTVQSHKVINQSYLESGKIVM